MGEEKRMFEEGEEGSIITEEIADKPLEEREAGPTSIDVTDERISTIGAPPPAEQQEEEVQEQNKQIEQAQEESKISKIKQKRRITSYLSNISKQVEKQGNQINKMTLVIQSFHKEKQNRTTTGLGIGQSQAQFVKQIQSQISQLQKLVIQIQNDIRRIRTSSVTGTGAFRKRSSSTNVKPRSKKTKSLRKVQSGKQKRTAKNRMKKFK
ncbi:MAG: hypothetical protein WBL67_21875 [Nitrososphaeraceae archaeon]